MDERGYRTHLNRERLKLAVKLGRDVSYQEIAEKVGLNYMTVHRYATKSISRPDLDTVLRLAAYFGVPVEEFVYKENGEDVGVFTGVAAV